LRSVQRFPIRMKVRITGVFVSFLLPLNLLLLLNLLLNLPLNLPLNLLLKLHVRKRR